MHYVPLRSDLSGESVDTDRAAVLTVAADGTRMLRFFLNRDNDDIARGIAERGRQFILNHLRMEDIEAYWDRLLRAYTDLLRFPVPTAPADYTHLTLEAKQAYEHKMEQQQKRILARKRANQARK